jgi:hypothetical protein
MIREQRAKDGAAIEPPCGWSRLGAVVLREAWYRDVAHAAARRVTLKHLRQNHFAAQHSRTEAQQ